MMFEFVGKESSSDASTPRYVPTLESAGASYQAHSPLTLHDQISSAIHEAQGVISLDDSAFWTFSEVIPITDISALPLRLQALAQMKLNQWLDVDVLPAGAMWQTLNDGEHLVMVSEDGTKVIVQENDSWVIGRS